jgi:ABC-type transport system involved in cytochrome bd biosynthesis fused ATPase/permease subunit
VLVAAAVMLGASIAVLTMLGAAGLALAATLAISAVVSWSVSARVAAASARGQGSARAQLTGELVEAIDGAAELALFGRAPDHVSRLGDSDARLARLGRRDAAAGALATGLQSLFSGAGMLIVSLVGVAAVRSGSLPGVLLAAVAFLFLGASESIQPLRLAARRLLAVAAAAGRLEQITGRQPAVLDPRQPITLANGRAAAMVLGDVSMSYSATSPAVLRHIDLRLARGEHLALIGESGAGKTTLAELLVRFHDPQQGAVLLDGVDVRQIAHDQLRRAVLLCGQDGAHVQHDDPREPPDRPTNCPRLGAVGRAAGSRAR